MPTNAGLKLFRSIKKFVERQMSPYLRGVDQLAQDVRNIPSASHVRMLIEREISGRLAADMSAAIDAAISNLPTEERMVATIEAKVASIRGQKGDDGKSVTADDVMPALEQYLERRIAQWELDFERRATERHDRMISTFRQPKDGVDGADGKDGASIEDFEISADGRSITVSIKLGGEYQKRTAYLDVPIYRDVYESGRSYQKSDIVTYGGSWWIAVDNTSGDDYPSKSPRWKLCVKQGRPGKDAA